MKNQSSMLKITLAIAIIIPISIIFVVGLNGHLGKESFQLELLKTSLNLLLIGVLGMLLKELLLEHSKRKLQEEQKAELKYRKEQEEHKHRVEALNRLMEGYWGIKKGLHIIMGHKSAKSYKEQMHIVIDQRLNIQQLHNEILGGIYKFNSVEKVSSCLNELDKQLELLVDEWTNKHLGLSWQQSLDEKTDPDKKEVPAMISELQYLGAVWNEIGIIHDPYQEVADLMRKDISYDENTLPAMESERGGR